MVKKSIYKVALGLFEREGIVVSNEYIYLNKYFMN